MQGNHPKVNESQGKKSAQETTGDEAEAELAQQIARSAAQAQVHINMSAALVHCAVSY